MQYIGYGVASLKSNLLLITMDTLNANNVRKKNSKNANAGGKATRNRSKIHLWFYTRCIESKRFFPEPRMSASGLCMCGLDYEKLKLFRPYYRDKRKYEVDDRYWASGYRSGHIFQFTEMRQNVVLFLAAMNREL